MDKAEALQRIRSTDSLTISSTLAAVALGMNPIGLRNMARKKPESLPFPVMFSGRNVKVMRLPFMEFCGMAERMVDDAL